MIVCIPIYRVNVNLTHGLFVHSVEIPNTGLFSIIRYLCSYVNNTAVSQFIFKL